MTPWLYQQGGGGVFPHLPWEKKNRGCGCTFAKVVNANCTPPILLSHSHSHTRTLLAVQLCLCQVNKSTARLLCTGW